MYQTYLKLKESVFLCFPNPPINRCPKQHPLSSLPRSLTNILHHFHLVAYFWIPSSWYESLDRAVENPAQPIHSLFLDRRRRISNSTLKHRRHWNNGTYDLLYLRPTHQVVVINLPRPQNTRTHPSPCPCPNIPCNTFRRGQSRPRPYPEATLQLQRLNHTRRWMVIVTARTALFLPLGVLRSNAPPPPPLLGGAVWRRRLVENNARARVANIVVAAGVKWLV
ncbi:hypothetical protein B0H12DRAFT_1083647 [Mycena haematopus]|nr:hypothetical protein B0H12DRAFT_1083647 [Mycena haematopus]